ncbi:hypothetical protein MtrunA17_Chr3g0100291 [Medicago truncatula]|uniref:Uncharacterized protein n=1 Tax=Medicago truncatula TaxID=3880 RepID=A0A396INR3_MEDTR|nr:hypothetical protein MtrunA17_Chr3g0100291 [Medicago truncatula]
MVLKNFFNSLRKKRKMSHQTVTSTSRWCFSTTFFRQGQSFCRVDSKCR